MFNRLLRSKKVASKDPVIKYSDLMSKILRNISEDAFSPDSLQELYELVAELTTSMPAQAKIAPNEAVADLIQQVQMLTGALISTAIPLHSQIIHEIEHNANSWN